LNRKRISKTQSSHNLGVLRTSVAFFGKFRPIEQWNCDTIRMSDVKQSLTVHPYMSNDEKWNVFLIVLTHRYLPVFLSSMGESFRLMYTRGFAESVTAFPWIAKPESELSKCYKCFQPMRTAKCPTCLWSLTSMENLCVRCLPHTKIMCAHFTLITSLFVDWLSYTHGERVIPEHMLAEFERREERIPMLNAADIASMSCAHILPRSLLTRADASGFTYEYLRLIIDYVGFETPSIVVKKNLSPDPFDEVYQKNQSLKQQVDVVKTDTISSKDKLKRRLAQKRKDARKPSYHVHNCTCKEKH